MKKRTEIIDMRVNARLEFSLANADIETDPVGYWVFDDW